MTIIETRTIFDGTLQQKQLQGLSFFVKDYQRGYRWDKQQIEALLEDIKKFTVVADSKYCLQPLVVKKQIIRSNTQITRLENGGISGFNLTKDIEVFEVIDGQQRLTTLLLIFDCCNKAYSTPTKLPYDIYYEITRSVDKTYLKDAVKCIDDWFNGFGALSNKEKTDMFSKLLTDIMFIWYEVEQTAKSEEIFTKLNMGKIPLTSAELFKALLLDKEKLSSQEKQEVEKIAFEWDSLEQALHNDTFWYFISNKACETETRIDFILRLYAAKLLDSKKVLLKVENEDCWYTFLIINDYLTNIPSGLSLFEHRKNIWNEIRLIFDMLKYWQEDNDDILSKAYQNRELYHNIGFLISLAKKDIDSNINVITEIMTKCNGKTKKESKCIVKNMIKNKFVFNSIKLKIDDLDYGKSSDKDKIRLVILYFNILTIMQSKSDARFNFQLYNEQKWDIEHIHARATDEEIKEIITPKKREAFLTEYKRYFVSIEDKANEIKIDQYIKNEIKKSIPPTADEFLKFIDDINRQYGDFNENSIGNLTLLDCKTNREYGNAIFPFKRKVIIEKDMGVVFVPPCTKNVFLKMYSTSVGNSMEWMSDDVKNYTDAIKGVLINKEGLCQ